MAKRQPEKLLTLSEEVVEHNTTLGAASPLANGDVVDMTEFSALVAEARKQRNLAEEYYAMAHVAMNESRVLLGMAAGQTVNTPDTVRYLLNKIKKILLVLNNENPEALSPWGFDVVVREARNRKRK